MRIPLAAAIALSCSLAAPAAAPAQEFPPDDGWTALRCAGAPMTDPVADQPGAVDERDIVGTEAAPAGFRAVDADFLYLRLRLDATPAAAAGALRPFAWGFLFDLDLDDGDFELLIRASGVDQTVSVYRNETTTSPGDPADPPDEPAAAVYDWADAGRDAPAGSNSGGDADRFLDLAIPWDDLTPLGLNPLTRVRVWAATSTTDEVLDGDLACHDGSGGGDPSLEGTGSETTTPDPDGDGGGGGGGGEGEGELEGGGGCSAGAGAGGPGAWIALGVLLLVVRRGRRSTPA